jgi:rod shape determining protein RodA
MEPWATPHLLQGAIFLLMALGIRLIRLKLLQSLSFPVYVASLLLLILVEVIGQVGGGSQRWLAFGPITIQPSELMKIALIMALARFYDLLPPGDVPTRRAVWPALAMMTVPALLVLIQPDLDAALILLIGGGVVMFLAGVPLRVFYLGAGVAAILAPLAYFFVLEEYQQRRLIGFLDPESDPLGTGYHVIQSKIAIGSGGILGRGFLNGTQGSLDYLPEHHTDLAFSAMFEEWGLIGGLILLATYAWLLTWGFRTADAAKTRYAGLLGMGLTTTIFFYIAMNLLTATGIAPVMGVPLPLISHGGSAMMTILIAIGLLMAIERESQIR